jgi:F-type H+-transporting ATPase subunit b
MEHEHLAINWVHIAAGYVNFALLLVVLRALLRKPLTEYLKNHRAEVEEEILLSTKLKAKAEARYAEYQAKVQNLDTDLARIRAEMVEAGKAERDRMVAIAEEKASRMRKETQFLIDQQRRQLRFNLIDSTAEAVVGEAQKFVQARKTESDETRLAEQFLQDLKRWHESPKKSPEGTRGGPRGGSVRPPSAPPLSGGSSGGSRPAALGIRAAGESRS